MDKYGAPIMWCKLMFCFCFIDRGEAPQGLIYICMDCLNFYQECTTPNIYLLKFAMNNVVHD